MEVAALLSLVNEYAPLRKAAPLVLRGLLTPLDLEGPRRDEPGEGAGRSGGDRRVGAPARACQSRRHTAHGAGERWITVHPNGPGEKGTPILIKIQPFSSAKVLGGLGSCGASECTYLVIVQRLRNKLPPKSLY